MEGYLAEIRFFAPNFAPRYWMLCQGQLLAIATNQALFSLLGTTYGGDGRTTFGLPDFRSRVPVGTGQGAGLSNYVLGQIGGSETVTLGIPQIPAHTHSVSNINLTANLTFSCYSDAGTTDNPVGNYYAIAPNSIYNITPNAVMGANPVTVTGSASLGNTGGSQPHTNVMPSLGINTIICTQGIFPSRN